MLCSRASRAPRHTACFHAESRFQSQVCRPLQARRPDPSRRANSCASLESGDAALCRQLRDARADPDRLAAKQESELLIALAPHLDDFIAGLFGIESEVQQLSARHNELAPLYTCKRLFVQRKALHKYKADDASRFDGAALRGELTPLIRRRISASLPLRRHVMRWLDEEKRARRRDSILHCVMPRGRCKRRPAGRSMRRRVVQSAAQARLPASGAARHR